MIWEDLNENLIVPDLEAENSEEVFEKLISVEFSKKLEEASSSFNFLQEERFNRVRLL